MRLNTILVPLCFLILLSQYLWDPAVIRSWLDKSVKSTEVHVLKALE